MEQLNSTIPVLMPCQVSYIFLRWIIAIWILYAYRTNCGVGNLCGWHCEFYETMLGQFFRNLIVAGQCHSYDHLMCCICTCKETFFTYCKIIAHLNMCVVANKPCPSFGNRGHRQTIARWWCSYLACPDVTSISDSCNWSTVPKIRSIPLILPVRLCADFTEPYLWIKNEIWSDIKWNSQRIERISPKVFLYAEQINPTFGNRKTDWDIFTWNLTELSWSESRHQNVSTQFNLKIRFWYYSCLSLFHFRY